jgi:hypothetical protein
MVRLRRSGWFRLLAVVLMIGSPGLGGAGLQAMHGCTEQMPWLAGSGDVVPGSHDADSGHHGGHDDAPAESGCHCIGDCQATPAMASPSAGALVRWDDVPAAGSPLAGASRVAPAGRTAHRLPPATAPPLI